MKPLLIALLLSLVVAGSGCVQQEVDREAVRATTACTLLCKIELQQGRDLSSGPCLSEDFQEGWVCDVAHSPRLPVDDLPENQCESFGKTANRFVELDEYCEPIQIY